MLMAAGLGTRLRPLTDKTPKALMPLMGIPIAQFAIDSLLAVNVRRIVANVHHLPEKAKSGLCGLYPDIVLSDESELLLGSAGGIKKALPLLGEHSFVLMNADILCDIDLLALAKRHEFLKNKYNVLMTLALLPGSKSGENLTGEKYKEVLFDSGTGLIGRLGEIVSGKPYYAGIAVIEPEALMKVPEGTSEFVPEILLPAIKAARAGTFIHHGFWYDIGTPKLWRESHFALIERLEAGVLPQMWRSRLEKENRQISKGIWVSKNAPSSLDFTDRQAPCYWNGGFI